MTGAILAGLVLAATAAGSPRFGIAVASPEGAFLALAGPPLPAGSAVTVVVPGDPQTLLRARVADAVASCAPCTRADVKGPYYRLEGLDGLDRAAVAVLGEPAARVSEGVVRMKLGVRAPSATVRACTSSEGVHFTVWAGPPLASARLWHEYWYLDMDVESTCVEKDYQESPSRR